MNVAAACRSLAHAGLVIGTQGNASERLGNQMLIKPSGVRCADMRQGRFAAIALDTGETFVGSPTPSTDTEAHRWIYNALPEIGGIVHTHSPWASAWAVAGKPIPCCTTGQADVFGGDIPCSEYCPIGDADIGKEIVRLYRQDRTRRAFLIRQHGVFAIGESLDETVNAAIFVEHFAHITLMASRLAGLKLIPKDEIAANFERYQKRYGQPASDSGQHPDPARLGDR